MTICNVDGLSFLQEQKLSLLEFTNNMRAKKEQWPYDRMTSVMSDLTEDEYSIVWENLLLSNSYLSSIGTEQALELFWSQPLIVNCSLSGSSHNIACGKITRGSWDPIYRGCYTIHVPDNMAEVCESIQIYQQREQKAVLIVP